MAFSFDVSTMLVTAGMMVQGMSPVLIILGGLALAFSVIYLFLAFTRTMFRTDRRYNPFRRWPRD